MLDSQDCPQNTNYCRQKDSYIQVGELMTVAWQIIVEELAMSSPFFLLFIVCMYYGDIRV